ncbi:50S ribosomal protein L19 [Candidatus Uzinura diaspidicola str. ASNER]|uniref:Large ribosomal subunit protein bL19 n=1 Tax=Candidatus Uzinura diaspidicola str. ASNER TaxID=1133592 RepID=L7VJQ7_9FLAO|nr:50S ribosomal protein L19 [Candidatus Uzinura diaspidicola str. ASNER]
MQTLIKYVEKKFIYKKIWPTFSSGDTIKIFSEIREGTKTRVQYFKGVVIQCRGKGTSETFTVRKISDGVGIERIFFVSQPNIKQIEIYKQGKVRQARIYYFSSLKGKKARIKDNIR